MTEKDREDKGKGEKGSEEEKGPEGRKEGERGDGGEGGKGSFRGLAMLSSIGITMVASTFIGLLIGIYLDKYFDTSPWLTIIFLIFGIAAGFKQIYETVQKYGS